MHRIEAEITNSPNIEADLSKRRIIVSDLKTKHIIRANIAKRHLFHTEFKQQKNVDATVRIPTVIIRDKPPIYEGEMIVTPKAHQVTVLPTKDRLVEDDISVLKIPYYETSNESGTTVYIADEV